MSAVTTIPAGPWTELVDGTYREVARGDDVTVERPFPVRVRLSR